MHKENLEKMSKIWLHHILFNLIFVIIINEIINVYQTILLKLSNWIWAKELYNLRYPQTKQFQWEAMKYL